MLADLNALAHDPLHVTFHGLRKTMATDLGKLGVSRFTQDRILNHADSTIGGRYDQHDYLAEMLEPVLRKGSLLFLSQRLRLASYQTVRPPLRNTAPESSLEPVRKRTNVGESQHLGDIT